MCQYIVFRRPLPLLQKTGINVVFSPHAHKNERYKNIIIAPFPHIALNGTFPAENKDIWYSFIGANTHAVRKEIFNMKHPDTVVIIQRARWYYSNLPEVLEQEKREYQDVLSRSRFSLCPRGTGPNTLRFWESLQAGAIPVLISDAMALPNSFDWDSCITKIAERNVHSIGAVLSDISPEQEEYMRKNCLACFKQFSEDNFVSVIREYYTRVVRRMLIAVQNLNDENY